MAYVEMKITKLDRIYKFIGDEDMIYGIKKRLTTFNNDEDMNKAIDKIQHDLVVLGTFSLPN